MKFRKCPHCGDFGFYPRHRCPPQWQARIPKDCELYDGTEDAVTVYARDAERAAEKFAEQWDFDDMLSYHTLTVEVAPLLDPDAIQRFTVGCEWLPHYSARLAKNNDEEHPDET